MEDDGTYQKYESPKFFVGSGSPMRKQGSKEGLAADEEVKEQTTS